MKELSWGELVIETPQQVSHALCSPIAHVSPLVAG
jgi:hypothetical protein